jgi:hypothetical protein
MTADRFLPERCFVWVWNVHLTAEKGVHKAQDDSIAMLHALEILSLGQSADKHSAWLLAFRL